MSETWETFLRVEPLTLRDEAPPLDDQWMIQRGVDPSSPAVLRHLRDDVVPLVNDLRPELWQFSFLVHAFPLVPTEATDTALYIHLRLEFLDNPVEPVMRALAAKWRFTRRWDKGEIAGVDSQVVDVDSRWDLLERQSEWLLNLVEEHRDADLGTLVKHVRQYLHFFANMAQMRVA